VLILMLIIGCDPTWNIPSKGNTGCTSRSWYMDLDGDGFGATTGEVWGCEPPEADGWVETAGDCDDEYETTYPGAPELCDELDNDCDGDAADLGLVTFWPEIGLPEPVEGGFGGTLLELNTPGTLRICDGDHVGQLQVSAIGLIVEGIGGAALTSLDAQEVGSVVSVEEGAELILIGLTLTGGDTEGRGGGLSCSGAVVTLIGVTISENHAKDGGGLNAEQGCILTAQDVTIRKNIADDLGGGARFDTATLRVNGLNLQGNSAEEEGGGLYAKSSVISGDDLAARSNEAPLAAGMSWASTAGVLDKITLSNNTADKDGGGLSLMDSTLTASTGEVNGNTCDVEGGAFLISGTSSLTLTDTSIYENEARQGAGVWLNSASRFTWTGGSWSDNDPDDAYHGSMSWTLEGSNGGECSGSVCTIY
jgi:hypothetical protein